MTTTEQTKETVRGYFAAVSAGDIAAIEALFSDNVTFWVPPSLPDGITFRGKAQVMRLFTESVALYDADAGMDIKVTSMTAEAERVAVELEIRGRAATGGAPYENFYHFLFEVHAGKITSIREHLDSLYAFRTLFVPTRMTTPESCPWLPDKD